jgi:hypothetical protein
MLGAITVGAVSTQPSSDSDRDRAHRIFDATREAVTQHVSPPYVVFTLQDAGHSESSKQSERLRVLVRASDGAAVVLPLKNQNGVDVANPSPLVVTGPSYGSLSYIVRLGDFALYDFGLRYGKPVRPGLFDAPGSPEPEATQLQTLAVVRAYNPGYSIVDLGDTTLDGHPVYHLGLSPMRDAGHRVLREMWIDKGTYLPLRYLAAIPVSYAIGKLLENDATVDTTLIDGHLTNTAVNGRYRIKLENKETNGIVNWSITDVSFPASEPDWVFDTQQWWQHNGEAIPNFEPSRHLEEP